jgi:hypothetical protein
METKTWMAGTNPAMTLVEGACAPHAPFLLTKTPECQ